MRSDEAECLDAVAQRAMSTALEAWGVHHAGAAMASVIEREMRAAIAEARESDRQRIADYEWFERNGRDFYLNPHGDWEWRGDPERIHYGTLREMIRAARTKGGGDGE